MTRKRTRKPKKRWLLCQVKPGQIDRACEDVARQGYEPYSPTFWNDRTHKRQSLFTGYLFVECHAAWGSLSSTHGLVRVITFGDVAAVVPTAEVQRLKKSENKHGNVELNKIDFTVLEPIEIIQGRMKGLVGNFGGHDEEGRIKFLFSMLGMPSQTRVSPRHVARRAVQSSSPAIVGGWRTKGRTS